MGTCDGMVQLRRARDTDARGIAEVHVRTWQAAYRDLFPEHYLNALDVDARERHWASELRILPADRRPWVAQADTEIVGFAAAGPARDDAASSSTGEVYAIYVLPDCWDRGLGRNLLTHAERDLVANGYSDAVLWVAADNERARDFYQRAGWHADGGERTEHIGGQEVAEVRHRRALERSRVGELA